MIVKGYENGYKFGRLLGLIEQVRLHSENLELINDFVMKLEPKIMLTSIEDDLPIQTGDACSFIKLLQDANTFDPDPDVDYEDTTDERGGGTEIEVYHVRSMKK